MRNTLLLISLFIFCTGTAQKQWVLASKHLAKQDTVWLFCPENKKEKQLWPTIILLNGYGGNHKQWDSLLDLQKMADEYGFAFICPDGLIDSWYFNSRNKQGSNYESFFFEDLLPTLLKDFPVDPDNLFIDGLSMGGHGAIRFFLKKPHLFKAAGSTSGVLDLKCSGLRNTNLKKHLGTYNRSTWNSYTAIGNLRRCTTRKKPLIIDCGRQDHLISCNRSFVKEALGLGYNITYIEQEGKHNRKYWKENFYLHLAFYKKLVGEN